MGAFHAFPEMVSAQPNDGMDAALTLKYGATVSLQYVDGRRVARGELCSSNKIQRPSDFFLASGLSLETFRLIFALSINLTYQERAVYFLSSRAKVYQANVVCNPLLRVEERDHCHR